MALDNRDTILGTLFGLGEAIAEECDEESVELTFRCGYCDRSISLKEPIFWDGCGFYCGERGCYETAKEMGCLQNCEDEDEYFGDEPLIAGGLD